MLLSAGEEFDHNSDNTHFLDLFGEPGEAKLETTLRKPQEHGLKTVERAPICAWQGGIFCISQWKASCSRSTRDLGRIKVAVTRGIKSSLEASMGSAMINNDTEERTAEVHLRGSYLGIEDNFSSGIIVEVVFNIKGLCAVFSSRVELC